MNPRPYQAEAINALNAWMPENDGNPCIVLPTGSGKTPVMAWLIQQYLTAWPGTRIMVLAHVRELLSQGVEKIQAIWPEAPVGVYSAGLGSRDMLQPIIYAGIQSVWQKACEFEPFDMIFVDEAHRIPLDGDAMYRKFIADAKLCNPNLRVVGFTATPFRLAGGPICGPDFILSEIVYDANVKSLIDQGYLCRLRSKVGDATPDLTNVHTRKGEFVTSEVQAAVEPLVIEAVDEAIIRLGDRKAVIFFCATVEHAYQVSEALKQRHAFTAPVISAKTPKEERKQTLDAFIAGNYRGVCNVNVLSEGFDAQRIDAVVMLRPTQSPGLYYQQVGRGLRLHPSKQDCLVLDFSGNIDRHGAIDAVEGEDPGRQTCPDCNEIFSRAISDCPDCGWFPTIECKGCGANVRKGTEQCPDCQYWIVGRTCRNEDCGVRNPPLSEACVNCGKEFDKVEREIKHTNKPSFTPILTDNTPWQIQVESVEVRRHEKAGKAASMMVTYRSKMNEPAREWICFEHQGYARTKAEQWWKNRFDTPVPDTVEEALSDMFLGHKLSQMTQAVTVRQSGKYTEIVKTELKGRMEYAAIGT